jgi:hypothetical protein
MMISCASMGNIIGTHWLDLLDLNLVQFAPVDIILDKSTLDAIMALKGHRVAKNVANQAISRLLSPHGLHVNITMFLPETQSVFDIPGLHCLLLSPVTIGTLATPRE